MSNPASDSQMAYYPIRIVSSETGVNAITLRAWERRYGLITPKRTAKGHRLYTEQDIRLIRQVVALLNRGIPISQAQAMINNGEELPEAPISTPARPSQWQHYRERLHKSVQDFDDQQVADLFHEVGQFFPVDVAMRFLFIPLYHHLRDNSSQTLGVARLRFYSAILQSRLAARLSDNTGDDPDTGQSPLILIANCTWEDDIQQLQSAILLKQLGLHPVWFSGMLTPDQLTELLQARPWQAAVLHIGNDQNDMQLGQLQRLAREGGLPVFVSGHNTNHQSALLAHGLITLGDDIHQAALTIRDLLTSLPK